MINRWESFTTKELGDILFALKCCPTFLDENGLRPFDPLLVELHEVYESREKVEDRSIDGLPF
jgi:hypothetical protein